MKKHLHVLRAGLAALGISLFGMGAHAQAPQPTGPSGPPPSATALGYARDILNAKNVQAIYGSAVPQVITRVKAQLVQSNLNLQKDLDEVSVKIAKDFAGREKEVGDQMVKIYAYTFSEAELKQIREFYSTPTGKKVIDLEPAAFVESQRFMSSWGEALAEEINTKMRAEMKARGKTVF